MVYLETSLGEFKIN